MLCEMYAVVLRKVPKHFISDEEEKPSGESVMNG